MKRLQGVAMGRPSRIAISVSSRNGGVSEVKVGGSVVSLGTGFLDAPEVAA
jgi:predicted PhzF superfamily epimerase YddE/YHI9